MVRGEEKWNLVVYIVTKRARALCQKLYYFYNSQLIVSKNYTQFKTAYFSWKKWPAVSKSSVWSN